MTARIRFTLEDDEVQKGLAEQRKKMRDNEKSIEGVVKEVLKLEKAQVRQAKSVIRNQKSQKQVLSDRIKALRTLGRVDAESAAESRAAIRKLIEAERERVAAIKETERTSTAAFKAERDEINKGVAASKKLVAATKSIDQAHDELRVSLKRAFDAGELGVREYRQSLAALDAEQAKVKKGNPFGGQALDAVKAYASGALSVGAAVAAVRKAYQEFREEVRRGRDETAKLRDPRTSLLQVSDETNFQKRVTRADNAAIKFGTSREKSAEALFDAISNEVERDFESILRADRVIPADIGAKFVGEFRKVFAKEKLSAEQALNLGLAAAGTSKFNVQEIQPQIRTAAQGSALLPGVEASDVAAFVSVLGSQFGDRTGTYVRTLQANLGAELLNQQDALATAAPEERAAIQANIDLLKQNLPDIVQSLSEGQNKELSDSITAGNKEVLTAFTVATQRLDDIRRTDATIERETALGGTDESLVSKRLRAFLSDPKLAADLAAQSSEVNRNVTAERNFSRDEALREQRRNDVNEDLTERGIGPVKRFVVNRALDLENIIFDATGFAKEQSRSSQESANSNRFATDLLGESKKQTKIAEEQAEATRRTAKAIEGLARPQQRAESLE